MSDKSPNRKQSKSIPEPQISADEQDFWESDPADQLEQEPDENVQDVLDELDELLEQSKTPNLSNSPIVADTEGADDILEELTGLDEEESEAVDADDEAKLAEDREEREEQEEGQEASSVAAAAAASATAKPSVGKKEGRKKRSMLEIVASVLSVVLLLALSFYFYRYAKDKLDIVTKDKWATNIPVKGNLANITEVKTWWGTPPENANVKGGVKLVPFVQLTLGEGTTSGKLRVVFYSYEKNSFNRNIAKGDPVTIPFSNGKFSNGKKTVTFICTDGFEDVAYFYHYKQQDENRWTIQVGEAAADSNDYKVFAHAPIDPKGSH